MNRKEARLIVRIIKEARHIDEANMTGILKFGQGRKPKDDRQPRAGQKEREILPAEQ